MFADFRKLMYLVPDADCDTRAGIITKWRDARPRPSYEEINAVDDAIVDAIEAEQEAANRPVTRAEFEALVAVVESLRPGGRAPV
jgi:hypothetical protein